MLATTALEDTRQFLEQMSLPNVMDATMLLRDEESMDEFVPHFFAFLSVASAEEVLLRWIICIQTYKHTYVCIYIHTYIHIVPYTRARTHTQTHTHTHTHTHRWIEMRMNQILQCNNEVN